MRTFQEIFDNVVTNLRRQWARSVNEEGTCLYRDGKGNKCAAGWEIPDELYTADMERTYITDLSEDDIAGRGSIIENPNCVFPGQVLKDKLRYTDEQLRFLRELQRIHDLELLDSWERHWSRLAEKYGLVYKVPQ